MKKYSEESVKSKLKELNEWRYIDNKIEKKFKFLDFSEAKAFGYLYFLFKSIYIYAKF